MKTMTRCKSYLPMAAVILAAAAVPAAAQQQVPFKGTFQGNDTVTLPTITQTITGTGTQVGQFSSTTLLTLGRPCGYGTLPGCGCGAWRYLQYRHANSHHYRWYGSIRRRPRELYPDALP
jgi:hypothetical protein